MDELSPECHSFVLTKKAEREAASAACRSDVSTFCPEAFEQGRWELRRCMMKHFHELSPNCSEFIRKKMDEVSPNACDSDASTLCSSTVGFSATLTCLKENIKIVTPECVRFLFKPALNATEEWYPGKFREHHDGKRDHEGWRHGRDHEDERHGDRDRDDWRHGWMKHKSEKKWERKSRRDQERLTESCGSEVNAFCSGMESLHDKKECLAMNYASLDKPCAEFLISSDSDEEEHHEHLMKLVFMIIGFILLVSLVCACRRRCKRRHQMWREMHRNMTRTQEPTRYIAVPTQSIPLPGQVQQAQMVPMPTAPQQLQPQSPPPTYSHGIVYSASPYTGGIPISAVPVAYNPQALSIVSHWNGRDGDTTCIR
jgi:hypothetical protein